MTHGQRDPRVVPYLSVSPGAEAIAWYVRAFAAVENNRFEMDDGRLGHAMLTLENGAAVYLADDFPDMI